MICELLEYEHAWSRLYTKVTLKKAGLLPALYVEIVEVPIDLGEYFAILRIFL